MKKQGKFAVYRQTIFVTGIVFVRHIELNIINTMGRLTRKAYKYIARERRTKIERLRHYEVEPHVFIK